MNAIISLTTIPERITHIEPCLRSLTAQGLPVYLWAVRKIERSPLELEAIPDFVKACGVHAEVVEDCGPITKLLPALEAGFETILTADDDVLYGANWAKRLLAYAEKFPNAALGFRGRVLTGRGYRKSKLVLGSRLKHPRPVDVLTGTWGILYQATLFDETIFSDWRVWPDNDDLVIAAYLKRRGLPLYVVPSRIAVKNAAWRDIQPLFGINTNRRAVHNNAGMKRLGLEG